MAVDNDVFILGTIINILKAEGLPVIAFTSEEEVLELLKSLRFDLIILDFDLRGLTRIEVFKIIKKSYPLTKIILLSRCIEENILKEADN